MVMKMSKIKIMHSITITQLFSINSERGLDIQVICDVDTTYLVEKDFLKLTRLIWLQLANYRLGAVWYRFRHIIELEDLNLCERLNRMYFPTGNHPFLPKRILGHCSSTFWVQGVCKPYHVISAQR
jgi:hypothetical protein